MFIIIIILSLLLYYINNDRLTIYQAYCKSWAVPSQIIYIPLQSRIPIIPTALPGEIVIHFNHIFHFQIPIQYSPLKNPWSLVISGT